MNIDRAKCAELALRQIPDNYRDIGVRELIGVDNGHHFHRGMHLGWRWGEDQRGVYLDFLNEHRMGGIHAERIHANGTVEQIATPAESYFVTGNPLDDAERERKFHEHNQAAYADLRRRGLLPPPGQNLGSQDINEFLLSGGELDKG
jgi:hypothetical protein